MEDGEEGKKKNLKKSLAHKNIMNIIRFILIVSGTNNLFFKKYARTQFWTLSLKT